MNKFNFLGVVLLSVLVQATVFPQKNAAVDLPMKWRGLTPAVEVMVNGKGPFLFAIDTGAGGEARVDVSLMKQLGLKVAGQVETGDGSGQNTRLLDVVSVDSLKIGGLEFRHVRAITRDYNTSPNLPKIDGIIGFNLFAAYLLTLDFPAKRVRVETGELPLANQEDILNFEAPNGIPVVDLQVGGRKIKAHIDSGNLVNGFILPAAVVEKSNLTGRPIVVGRARTVSSDIEIKEVRLKDLIRLGKFDFPEQTVSFPALSVANLGAAMMQNFAFTFDQKNKRVRLEKSQIAETTVVRVENPKEYVGVYGERTISGEDGNLYLQRTGGRKLRMVALAKDEFKLELLPAARLKFARGPDGKISALEILTPDGNWEKIKKQ